jgi:hypothetical protein
MKEFGIYVFRFFVDNDWKYVIIDDKLPCLKNTRKPKLIFASCEERNEFWVPLLEKAYAKLYGTYEALISG